MHFRIIQISDCLGT